jgi:hypothetical protein
MNKVVTRKLDEKAAVWDGWLFLTIKPLKHRGKEGTDELILFDSQSFFTHVASESSNEIR